MLFDGFALAHVPVPGGTIRLRHGGSGPPLLLLSMMRGKPVDARHLAPRGAGAGGAC